MRKRTEVTVLMLCVAMLGLWVLFMPDAAAQSRGGARGHTRSRSIRIPRQSGGGLRALSRTGRSGRGGLSGLSGRGGGIGRSSGSSRNPFSGSSRSGSSGLRALGDLLESAARDYHGGDRHNGNHHGYSDAEAYRDVGIANAVVSLVGILVDAGRDQAYGRAPAVPVAAPPVEVVPQPVVVAPPPVEVVPVPSAYPVAVVPAPQVVVRTPAYYGPPRYVHVAPYPSPPPCPSPYPGYSTTCPAPRRYPCYPETSSGYGHYPAPRTSAVPRTQSVHVSSRSGQRSSGRTTPRPSSTIQTRSVTSRGRTPIPSSSLTRTRRPAQRTAVRTPVPSRRGR